MTYTFSSVSEAVDFFGGHSFASDEAVSNTAYGLTFDDEGCLTAYWIPCGDGSSQRVFTARGEAAYAAVLADAEEISSNGKNAVGLLATDWALDDYNTWKA